MDPLDGLILGATPHGLHLNSAQDHREALLALVSQAKRAIHIYSRNLDPVVYDNPLLEEALTRFVLRSQNCQVFILIQDTSTAVKQGHALLRLAQKLSSKVHIKVPGENHKDYSSAFVVVDTTGYIRQPVATNYAAEGNFKAPFESRKLLQYFLEVWDQAEIDQQLRRLSL